MPLAWPGKPCGYRKGREPAVETHTPDIWTALGLETRGGWFAMRIPRNEVRQGREPATEIRGIGFTYRRARTRRREPVVDAGRAR